jgi:uncharacterized protein (DUF1501 family)
MKRRDFIKSTAIASAPLLLNKFPVLASSNLESSNLTAIAEAASNCNKILVIIQMNGGNDGLNTVFPLDKYSELTSARANILMSESNVLPLINNDTTGFHPAMPELKNLYDDGKLMIVQNVSYPNPSYSHFRATDIWFTGSDSNVSLDTGWLGRSLNTLYPNFPSAYPTTDMPDPLAIQIGSTVPFSLQGPNINMAYSVPDPNDLLNVINATTDPVPDSDYGAELAFLRLMKDQSNVYRTAIQAAYNVPQGQSATYPADNYLGEQLKIVARLINGGLKTPIYVVNHPNGFDTHEDQVLESNKTLGRHASALKVLSKAISAFQQDLTLIGKQDLVTGMTFSEFGRRIKSNESSGTDHGTCAPVMFFGAALNTGSSVANTPNPVSGMIGTSPDIPTNASVEDEIPMQFDYRQIYASVMQDWLCMTEAQTNAVLGNSYTKLPIFAQQLNLSTTNKFQKDFMVVFPNPVINNEININFANNINQNVTVRIFNLQASRIFSNSYFVGLNTLSITLNLNSGTYILEVEISGNKNVTKLLVL